MRGLKQHVVVAAVILAAPLLGPGAVGGAGSEDLSIPIGPGAKFTVISKTTTDDPLSVDTSGPAELQFSEITIAPGGTTGSLARPGIIVVNVDAGNATLALAGAAGCGSRTVAGGEGAVESGDSVSAIRNAGSGPLTLHLTTLRPKETVAATAAPGCPAVTERGVTAKVLNTSTVEAPMTARASGTSDVYVGLVQAEPGRSAGPWHKHPAPLFVGVDQGRATVKLAHGAHCEVLEVAEGGGLLEMPGMVHEASNPGHEPLAFYILGFAPSPQPLLTPQPTPAECQNA